MDTLDMGLSSIVDHNNPEFIKLLHNLKIHP